MYNRCILHKKAFFSLTLSCIVVTTVDSYLKSIVLNFQGF